MARGVEAFSEMQADSKGIGRTVMVHSPEGSLPAEKLLHPATDSQTHVHHCPGARASTRVDLT